MEIILLLIMILLYFVILYFINKQRAISLISELVKYAEIYIRGGDLKKSFVKQATSDFISNVTTSAPLTKAVTKVVESKVDKIIEKEVEKLPEKIDLSAQDNATLLVDKAMESDSKGLISVYGKIKGGEDKKVDYEVGVNYIKKL